MHFNAREMQNTNLFASWNKLLVVLYFTEINLKIANSKFTRTMQTFISLKKGKVLYKFLCVYWVISMVEYFKFNIWLGDRVGIEWSK